MAHASFSLTWDSHRNNLCNGLSALQQNEEFVDMTLAADGHHVKVHQMVIALASPYIKSLISSASCSHPVIFLNKISYQTLTAILEYIYTGEVLVSVDNLVDLIQAAKELHIKGLEEMNVDGSVKSMLKTKSINGEAQSEVDNDSLYFDVTVSERTSPFRHSNIEVDSGQRSEDYTAMDEGVVDDSQPGFDQTRDDDGMVVEEEITEDTYTEAPDVKPAHILGLTPKTKQIVRCTSVKPEFSEQLAGAPDENIPTTMQFTVSNQGSIQMILNRFVYYLKHSNQNNTRQWRCVDYLNNRKCPALVVTNDDVVVQRISAHSHPFHDKRILKKVFAKAVFTALHEAEKKGISIKSSKSKDTAETATNDR